jgi:hypothetical protein
MMEGMVANTMTFSNNFLKNFGIFLNVFSDAKKGGFCMVFLELF